MTNQQVVERWTARRRGYAAHLQTDGNTLWSYKLKIGEWRDGLPVVFNYTAHDDINPFGHRVPPLGFVSMTTSRHVGFARRVGYAFEL